MKFVIALGLLVLVLLLQYFLFVALGTDVIIPNVTLATLVVLSFYVDVEQLMWLGLVGGLFSDLYSGAEFGLYLGLFVLVVLVCKMILNFSSANRSWWLATVVLAVATFVQAIILSMPLLGSQLGHWPELVIQTLWFVCLTVVSGIILYFLLQYANQNFSRYFQAKAK